MIFTSLRFKTFFFFVRTNWRSTVGVIIALAFLSSATGVRGDPLFSSGNPLVRAEYKSQVEQEKVLYGEDNRTEVYQNIDSAKRAASAVVAMVYNRDLKLEPGGEFYVLPNRPTGSDRRWCTSERFHAQPSPAQCTGFMVGPDMIATAGHCVGPGSSFSCGEVSFVFGFEQLESGKTQLRIPVQNVYRCKQVVGGELESKGTGSGMDWRIVRVDSIQGRVPLEIRRTGKIPDATSLTVMGHPTGLPLKIAGGAVVKDNGKEAYFVSDLDTYGGNSGSPVFNTKSILDGRPVVEGILVRGATDFVPGAPGNCVVSNLCPLFGAGDCKGEDVTRTTKIAVPIQAPAAACDDRTRFLNPVLGIVGDPCAGSQGR